MKTQLLPATELFLNILFYLSFKIILIIDSGVCINTKMAETLQKYSILEKVTGKYYFMTQKPT